MSRSDLDKDINTLCTAQRCWHAGERYVRARVPATQCVSVDGPCAKMCHMRSKSPALPRLLTIRSYHPDPVENRGTSDCDTSAWGRLASQWAPPRRKVTSAAVYRLARSTTIYAIPSCDGAPSCLAPTADAFSDS